jgi:hypothetical protein
MGTGAFLRSINVSADLANPERFAHYRPTRKSLSVVRAVLEGDPSRATMVIATYGSGKSLAAGVAALIASNQNAGRETVGQIAPRIAGVDPRLGALVAERAASGASGLVIVLHGYVEDLAHEVAAAAGLKTERTLVETLNAVTKAARTQKCDRISVVWDEFGRHLDGLVAGGRAADLLDVQVLAEWGVRQADPTATITLLLHQSLLAYGGRINQTARSAWRKIEGRFEITRFTEDSVELYELLGEIIQTSTKLRREPAEARETARLAKANGYFDGFDDEDRLAVLLEGTGAFEPAALDMLPRVAARVAQNERTIFDFLARLAPDACVDVEALYVFFSEAMRSDAGMGGTHRRWVETESARSKAGSDLERSILAAACLLQLGVAGERQRLPEARLQFALSGGCEKKRRSAMRGIRHLLERNLLLHRKRNDDISVWHGADIDIHRLIEERSGSLAAEFSLIDALDQDCPAPHGFPLRHNAIHGITRFFRGHYVRASALLQEGGEHPLLAPCTERDGDGRLIHVIAESAEQRIAALDLARQVTRGRLDLVVAVPKRALEIGDAALELYTLREIAKDKSITEQDPLAEKEIAELAATSREGLSRLVDELTQPDRGLVHWVAEGKDLEIGAVLAPAEVLSRLADARFPKTPIIRNDQIVRRNVTRQMVNARKKCIGKIIEATGEPDLGMRGWTTPDASIARTVFIETGLYGGYGSSFDWADPADGKAITDDALWSIWCELKRFYQEPADEPKSFAVLVSNLQRPPFGLRQGLIPLLLAAGLRAFARCVAIRSISGTATYLDDIKPSVIEAIAADPNGFEIEVLEATKVVQDYLVSILDEFSVLRDHAESDLIRACYDAMTRWKAQLPSAALTTSRLGEDIREFQRVLRTYSDPVDLLFRAFPAISGSAGDWKAVAGVVGQMRRRVETLAEGYAAEAMSIAARHFGVLVNGSSTLIDKAQSWADCFPTHTIPAGSLDGKTNAILARARSAKNGRETDLSLARALSGILLGKDFEQWNDGSARIFERELAAQIEAVERAVLAGQHVSSATAPLLQKRVVSLVFRLRDALNSEEMTKFLESMKAEISKP